MVDIAWEKHGLVRTMSGTITVAEMDSSAQNIQGNPRLDEMHYNIHDFSAVIEAFLPDDDIEFLAARASVSVQRNPKLKIAFVGNHPVVHKLMKAFNESGYSPNRVHRFDTLKQARRFACEEN